jgi:hypothetical protein
MTKISVYNIDEYVTADDKWIGTDVNTYNKTKNFTPRKLSHYFNNNQVINTGVDLLYKYFTITPPETRPTGTLSFETEIGPTVNFSAISTFLLSKTTLKGNYIVEFFDFLVGTNVLMYKAKNINLFGSYKILSVEEYLPEPNFFVVNVEFIEGNGFIEEDEDYMISLIDISGGGGTQDLQDVTDIGATTTNDIQLLNSAEMRFGAGGGILLDNASRLREGTIDAGLGGSKGIAQICGVGYELKWEAGRLYVMDYSGYGIRQSLYNFDNVPTVNDDTTKEYRQGSLWSLDNGDVYECLDATTGAAVWDLKNTIDSPITIVNGNSLFSTGLTGTGFDSTAYGSIFLGENAGYESANVYNSIFLGQQVGYEATGAYNSVFLGHQTGNGATNAFLSNFIGLSAGYGATNANNSNFLGYQAGYSELLSFGASYSNFLGNNAGYESNADYSNFLGNNAGSGATNATNSNFFGPQAGEGATDASYSNFFGAQAGKSFTDNNVGSNNIIIGTNISLPDATANAINLGGVLFGTGTYSETAGDPSITPISGGKIGIGVVSPTNTLHIYSETEDTSGLRLERLTSASPTSTGQAIGVDASGNVVTVTGGGGGSQDLQSVTDEGATTTNPITITVGDGGANGITSFSSQGYGVKGESNETIGVYGVSASAAGVFGESAGGNGVEGVSVDGNAIYGNSSNVIGVYARSDYGTGLYGYTEDGVAISVQSNSIGLQVNGNGTIAIEANLGNSNKGLVINSGASSTGNFIELDKNGVDKLVVNQQGELTAQKLIKEGGTSSEILSADGSVITAGNNITITGGQISSVGGSGGGGSSVNYYLNGGTSQGAFGGTTYYEFSKTAVIGTGADFNISSNGYIASFITDVADPSLLLIPAGNWNLEFFFSSSSAGGSPSFYAELYKYDGTTFTLIASGSAVPEGITNGTAIDAYFTALAVPETVLTVNDRLAIRVYINAASKTITLHTQNGHLCEVITTFTAGLTALNGLQAQVQNFAVGTTGTDFAINSSGSTHTFNLPSASATARGVVTTGTQTIAGDKTFTGGITSNTIFASSTSDIAISAVSQDSDAISAESANGTGVFGSSTNGLGGYFNTVNGANIVEFQTNSVLKAKIDSGGLITGTGLNASGQTINTIASFDASKNVVSLPLATYPSLTELALLKGVSGSSVQIQLDGKVDENTAITGDTKTKITYDSKGLVTSGADATTADIADSTNKRYVTDANLVVIGNTSGTNTGDNATNTQYSGLAASKQDTLQSTVNIKSINGNTILGSGNLTITATAAAQSPFTMLANNSDASAIPTTQVYKDIAEQTYSGSPTWSGTAPTTILANTYKWNQVGSLVTVRLSLSYSVAGSNATVIIPLPTDLPTPSSPTGFTGASDILYYGVGMFNTSTTTVAVTPRTVLLRRNSANNGYEFLLTTGSLISIRVVHLTLQYFT